jgi:hypothetical protein
MPCKIGVKLNLTAKLVLVSVIVRYKFKDILNTL